MASHQDDPEAHDSDDSASLIDPSEAVDGAPTALGAGGAVPGGRFAQLDERAYEEAQRQKQLASDEHKEEAEGGEEKWAKENQELLEELEDSAEDLELTHSRIRTLRGFEPHFSRLSSTLRRLSLRQNLLASLLVEPLPASSQPPESTATETAGKTGEDETKAPLEVLRMLEDLDLYDNRISKIQGLSGLTTLQSLDLSFNLLRRIENLESLTSLRTIYLIQNKISKIEALEPLAASLTSLELGSNRIRRIDNLSMLTNLTELWLGKNKISKLEGLSTLVKLKTLSIQSNRIVELEGLGTLKDLEELYISHNGLKSLGDGLTHNSKLRVLDIAGNRMTDLSGLSHLTALEELWANDNLLTLAHWNEVLAPSLGKAHMPDLETVYFEGNPLQKEMGPAYRRKVMLACEQVKQIDATYTNTA